MTKKLRSQTRIIQQSVPFLNFWQDIASIIGDLELPLPTKPEDIKEMTSLLDGYFNPMKKCLLAVYKRNRCNHLLSPIKPSVTLDALGEINYELKTQPEVDVKDVDLLEHIGLYISRKYMHIQPQYNPEPKTAELIRLDWYRTHKANQRK
ncbi:MAG: hypothetical protein ACRBHB_18315 [Arenicella sp.]